LICFSNFNTDANPEIITVTTASGEIIDVSRSVRDESLTLALGAGDKLTGIVHVFDEEIDGTGEWIIPLELEPYVEITADNELLITQVPTATGLKMRVRKFPADDFEKALAYMAVYNENIDGLFHDESIELGYFPPPFPGSFNVACGGYSYALAYIGALQTRAKRCIKSHNLQEWQEIETPLIQHEMREICYNRKHKMFYGVGVFNGNLTIFSLSEYETEWNYFDTGQPIGAYQRCASIEDTLIVYNGSGINVQPIIYVFNVPDLTFETMSINAEIRANPAYDNWFSSSAANPTILRPFVDTDGKEKYFVLLGNQPWADIGWHVFIGYSPTGIPGSWIPFYRPSGAGGLSGSQRIANTFGGMSNGIVLAVAWRTASSQGANNGGYIGTARNVGAQELAGNVRFDLTNCLSVAQMNNRLVLYGTTTGNNNLIIHRVLLDRNVNGQFIQVRDTIEMQNRPVAPFSTGEFKDVCYTFHNTQGYTVIGDGSFA